MGLRVGDVDERDAAACAPVFAATADLVVVDEHVAGELRRVDADDLDALADVAVVAGADEVDLLRGWPGC